MGLDALGNRVRNLGPTPLSTSQLERDFPDVVAAFSLPDATFCAASKRGHLGTEIVRAPDHALQFTVVGDVLRGGSIVASLCRRFRFYLDESATPGYVEHYALQVAPSSRNRAVAGTILASSQDLYESAGLNRIELETGLTSGRWYWPRRGWNFSQPEKVVPQLQEWYRECLLALGEDADLASSLESGLDFGYVESRLQVAKSCSLEDLFHGRLAQEGVPATSFDHLTRLRRVAAYNGVGLAEAMPTGKALLMYRDPDQAAYAPSRLLPVNYPLTMPLHNVEDAGFLVYSEYLSTSRNSYVPTTQPASTSGSSHDDN